MKLRTAWIRSYRCLRDVELEFDDYTVLIGPNGSGKSSVLYALDWFFNGGDMAQEDVWGPRASGEDPSSRIEVEVEFDDLDQHDRDELGMYGRGETARFRRSWTAGVEKTIGNSLQGPGFARVPSCSAATPRRRINKWSAKSRGSQSGPAGLLGSLLSMRGRLTRMLWRARSGS